VQPPLHNPPLQHIRDGALVALAQSNLRSAHWPLR
jgi:hypothetical protein